MRAIALIVCLALAAGAASAEDPCVAEKVQCRDVICHGRQVLSNECQQSELGFSKSCACGDDIQESTLVAKVGKPAIRAQAQQQADTQAEEDCDEEADLGMQAEPNPRGFAFTFNLGRRAGPFGEEQQQAPRVYTYARPFGMMSMLGDDDNDMFSFPSLGMLFNVMRARQQMLQDSPSYMSRRVYFPSNGQTYRLVTREELEGMEQERAMAAAQQDKQRAVKQQVVDRMRAAVRERAEQKAVEEKAAAAFKALEAQNAPKPAIKLNKAPAAAPVEPVKVDEEARPWYTGYHAKRAFYCIASIALIMSVIALNASLLMCCAASRDDRDVDVEVVAATTPLLVEYEVQKVSNGKEMGASLEFKPLPREGTKA